MLSVVRSELTAFHVILLSIGVLFVRIRGRRCRIRRRRRYTLRIGRVKRRIKRFRRKLRIRIKRKWCRIKRTRRRWRIRVKRRWCRLYKRGRTWRYKYRGRVRTIRRVKITIRIRRRRIRVRRRRGLWFCRVKKSWKRIKRRTFGSYRYKGRRRIVRIRKGRRIRVGRKMYRIKKRIIRRRRKYIQNLVEALCLCIMVVIMRG